MRKNPHSSRRRFIVGLSATLGASLGTGLATPLLPAHANQAALFRIACAPPASGIWNTAAALARRLFASQLLHELPNANPQSESQTTRFRATAYTESHAARSALLTGATTSALLVSYEGATLPNNGLILGKAGDALLHFLVRPEIQINKTRPLAGLRIALNSERLLGDEKILTDLGAKQLLALSIADGFDALYGNGVDGIFFWDLPPNPFARTALENKRARQVVLRLKDEPTTTIGAGIYGGTLFAPRTTRPVHWILSDANHPLRSLLEEQADSLLQGLHEDIA